MCLTHRVQCEKTENSAVSEAEGLTVVHEHNKRKDTKLTAAQSTIYNIKRLDVSKDKESIHKQRIAKEKQKLQQLQQQQNLEYQQHYTQPHKNQQQQQQEHQLQQELKPIQQDVMHHQEYKGNYKTTEGGVDTTTSAKRYRAKKYRKSGKNSHGLNRKLLK